MRLILTRLKTFIICIHLETLKKSSVWPGWWRLWTDLYLDQQTNVDLFFQLLHKWKDFTWSEECDKAFEDLKAYLAHLPILSRPKKRWGLICVYSYYIACNKSGFGTSWRRNPKASVLCQQIPPRGWGPVLPSGKSYLGHHSCHEKASTLFSSPYSRHPYPVTVKGKSIAILCWCKRKKEGFLCIWHFYI